MVARSRLRSRLILACLVASSACGGDGTPSDGAQAPGGAGASGAPFGVGTGSVYLTGTGYGALGFKVSKTGDVELQGFDTTGVVGLGQGRISGSGPWQAQGGGTMTVPIYGAVAATWSGTVDYLPGSKTKFRMQGTFDAAGAGRTWTGTWNAQSLDWAPVEVQGVDEIADVAFSDAQKGWMLAYMSSGESIVLATTDGGITWAQKLSSMKHVSKIVPGKDGRVWLAYGNTESTDRSDDGGASWQPAPAAFFPLDGDPNHPFAHRDVRALFFVDATHGWAVRASGAGTAAHLFRTQDGGKSWAKLRSVGTESSFSSKPHPMQFVTPTKGWVTDNSHSGLLYTEDGGQSWTSQGSMGGFEDAGICMADESVGWAMGGGGLFKTTNGGKAWEPVEWQQKAGQCFTRELACLGASHVWMTCENPPAIKVTHDAGATWASYAAPTNFYRPQIVGESLGFALDGNERLMRTDDGGKTWQVVSALTTGARTFRFFDAGSATALTPDGLRSTADGGATWSAPVPVPGLATTGFFFLDPQQAWCAAESMLSRTQDGGSTWQVFASSAGATDLETAGERVWVATQKGLLRSTDNGESWWLAPRQVRNLFSAADGALFGICEPQPSEPQSSGGLCASQDGGATWKVQQTIEGDGQFCFKDDKVGWFFRSGLMGSYSTQDGKTWAPYTTGTAQVSVRTGACTSSELWVSGPVAGKNTYDYRIWRTEGSQTWSPMAAPIEFTKSGGAVRPSAASPTRMRARDHGGSGWALWRTGLLRYLTDEAYSQYDGPAYMGTPPSTGSSGNRSPVLDPISAEVFHNYDADGNPMGSRYTLTAHATDPDGDPISYAWSVSTTSGSATLSSKTGPTTIMITDTFGHGTVQVKASDGKGGEAMRPYSF